MLHVITAVWLACLLCNATGSDLTSKKRGLCYVGAGANIWTSKYSDLTWYYNYADSPSIQGGNMEYVPMLWGESTESDFSSTVQGLSNIKNVLGMNEPDLCPADSSGGSCISPKKAAAIWKEQIEPLKSHGISLGAPAVTSGGQWWLQEFFTACDGGCSPDFLPLHPYSDFAYLAAYVGLMHKTYPNMTIWVTEFAYPNATASEAEQYLNQTVNFLDGLDYVDRYSYFGAFPPDSASAWVGSGGAMMNDDGGLNEVGARYLGLTPEEAKKAGVTSESGASSLSRACLSVWGTFALAFVWLMAF